MSAFGFDTHNHNNCIAGAVSSAQAFCRDAGLKLTPLRARVLEILLQEHRAMGAYEVLDRLREDGLGSQPPAAYRALEFLVTNGFAHRIERLNAFIACTRPGESHRPAFLICRMCNHVAEAAGPSAGAGLGKIANDAGFAIENTVVEAEGICPNCQDSE